MSKEPRPYVSVSSKGQMVIPSRLRRRLGIREGTRMYVTEQDGNLILHPVTDEAIRSGRGLLRGKGGRKSAVRELLEERRRDREREDRKARR